MKNQSQTLPRRPAAKRRVSGPRRRHEAVAALVFLAPLMIGLSAFVLYPLLASLYYSFTKWNLVTPAPTWVGLENWRYLTTDPRVGQTLGNTVRFLLTGTSSYLIVAFLLALALSASRRGTAFFRGTFLLPWMMSGIAAGAVWTWMFNSRSGPAAAIIGLLTNQNSNLLLDPAQAMTAIAIATTWQGAGYGMIIFIAGMNSISPELYEAAVIDGANSWHRLRYITVPLLAPTILFLVTTALIGGFQLYDPVIAMTSSYDVGGPNGSTRTLVLYLYQQMFELSEQHSGLGYASVIAWLLALIIFSVTLLQWTITRRGSRRGKGE